MRATIVEARKLHQQGSITESEKKRRIAKAEECCRKEEASIQAQLNNLAQPNKDDQT